MIAAGGSLVALIKFWMDIGKAQQIAEDAKVQCAVTNAKLDLLTANVSDYKVSVAETYATAGSLREAEQSLARSLENATQGINSRLDAMNQRLDSVIAITKDHR
jgi:hypothetical protein